MVYQSSASVVIAQTTHMKESQTMTKHGPTKGAISRLEVCMLASWSMEFGEAQAVERIWSCASTKGGIM